jgi:hypothetical protein
LTLKHLIVVVFALAIGISTLNAGPIIKDTGVKYGYNNQASLSLERSKGGSESEGILELNVLVDNSKNLKGYGFVLNYDTLRYEFVEVVPIIGSFIADSEITHPFFVSHATKGRVNVSGMKVGHDSFSGSGKLVKFSFKTTRQIWRNPSNDDFNIFEGILLDNQGGTNPVDTVTGNLKGIPLIYALEQNAPNPFNPTTTISYHLPEDTYVKLCVYNVLGQQVKELVKYEQNSGYYSVTWDSTDDLGRKVASGIYAYRITTKNFTSSRRMVLVK